MNGRTNEKFLAEGESKDDALAEERQILNERLEKLRGNRDVKEAVKFNRFDREHPIDYPNWSFDSYHGQVGDKKLSYEMLLNVIGRRFHKCLHQVSLENPTLG